MWHLIATPKQSAYDFAYRQRHSYNTFAITLLAFMIAMLMCVIPARADNHDVLDRANVLDQATERRIYDVDENQLSKIKGHPQIAVVTERSVDGDIEDEAQRLFEKYQFGTKGYDNGVLLLIDVEGHQVRMHTGYGVESAVPDAFVNDLVDETVKSYFRERDFSAGTDLMVQRLAKRIEDHQGDLRSKSVVNNHRALVEKRAQEMEKIWCAVMFAVLVLIFVLICLFFLMYRRAQINFNKVKQIIQPVVEAQKLPIDFKRVALPNETSYWIGQSARENSPTFYELINLQILDQLIQRKHPKLKLFNEKGSFSLPSAEQEIVGKMKLRKPLSDYQKTADDLTKKLRKAAKDRGHVSDNDLLTAATGIWVLDELSHQNDDEHHHHHHHDDNDDDWDDWDDWGSGGFGGGGSFGGGGGFSGGGGGTANW